MKKEFKEESKKEKKLVALKDFKFSDGRNIYDLKKGEAIDVPKRFIPNLKTENVIK